VCVCDFQLLSLRAWERENTFEEKSLFGNVVTKNRGKESFGTLYRGLTIAVKREQNRHDNKEGEPRKQKC